MPRLRTLLISTALAGALVAGAAPADAMGGKHYATVLKSHGLKEQACVDSIGTVYFQGDGRGSKREFALVDNTFSSNGVEDGHVGTSISPGRKVAQGGLTGLGDLLTVKMKIYVTGHQKVVGKAKAKVAVSDLAAC